MKELKELNEAAQKRRKNLYFKNYNNNKSLPSYIAFGDSWFEYPEYFLLGDSGDIIDHLMKDYGNIYCISAAGNEAIEMINSKNYIAALNLLKNNNHKIQGIIFSGGGNDIVGGYLAPYTTEKEYRDNYPDLIDPYEQNKSIDEHLVNYEKKIIQILQAYKKLRDEIDNNIHLIIHGYDSGITPTTNGYNDIPPKSGWVGRRLKIQKFPEEKWKEIVKTMIDKFNQELIKFASDKKNVHYIDLRGKVKRWKDEMHPNNESCKHIARIFLEKIRKINSIT
jgi:hypothetical protein